MENKDIVFKYADTIINKDQIRNIFGTITFSLIGIISASAASPFPGLAGGRATKVNILKINRLWWVG